MKKEKSMMIYNLTHHKTVTFRCVATYVSNIMKNRLQPDSHSQKERWLKGQNLIRE